MMLVKWAGRLRVIWFYMAALVVIILCYGIVILTSSDTGRVGLYIWPVLSTLVRVVMVAWAVLVISGIVYALRCRNIKRAGLVVLVGVVLFLPIISNVPTPPLLRRPIDTLIVPDHTYQLAEDMFNTCPDPFKSTTPVTGKCAYKVYVYQCDGSGWLCSLKSPDLFIPHEQPLKLQFEGSAVEVIGDDNRIVYTLPTS